MNNDACIIPSRGQGPEGDVIERLLGSGRVAIVGLSDDPSRPSYEIATYLLRQGYAVVPVNPNHDSVLGMKCYPTLKDVPGEVDLVNVFRRSEFCADVTREAISSGAKGVWLQSGIRNETARKLAADAGIDFVQDRCILVEHRFRGR